MKRTDFFQLVQPLTEKLYSMAYALVPDDLQAEQLVIDSMNAFLLKEKKSVLLRTVDVESKKNVQLLRRTYFKTLLRYMCEIGVRRSNQLGDSSIAVDPEGFQAFFSLDPKIRFVLKLRFETQFTVEEIEEIAQLPKYEVIEKLHNGRFLLLNDLNHGVSL
jgi:DNA-directed RNA polymerase specialized sigma24 family protein